MEVWPVTCGTKGQHGWECGWCRRPLETRASNHPSRKWKLYNHGEGPYGWVDQDRFLKAPVPHDFCIRVPISCLLTVVVSDCDYTTLNAKVRFQLYWRLWRPGDHTGRIRPVFAPTSIPNNNCGDCQGVKERDTSASPALLQLSFYVSLLVPQID